MVFRDEFFYRHLRVEIRISQKLRPIRIRSPHRFREKVEVPGRIVPCSAEVEALENVEHFHEHDAAAYGAAVAE